MSEHEPSAPGAEVTDPWVPPAVPPVVPPVVLDAAVLDPPVVDSVVLAGWVHALGSIGDDPESLPDTTDATDDGTGSVGGGVGVSDAERVEQLVVLERLKAAAAAAQARVTVAFEASQRAGQRAAGLPERKVGAGIAAQVGLARRDSPVRGARHLGLARALLTELPHTMAALTRGDTSEWRATLIARETACLTRTDRARVDAELATRPGGSAPWETGRPPRRPAGSGTGSTRTP